MAGHPHPKRKLVRSLLANGMCDFEDGTRAATAARKASAELDGKYKRLRRLGAKLAHKAQWHGFQPICIANTPYAVRCLQRTSDCYEVNRVSVAPRTTIAFCRELPLFEWSGATRQATHPVNVL